MLNLLYTEFLKMKRAKMFLISILGAATAPVLCFLDLLNRKIQEPNLDIYLKDLFFQTNFYIVLIIGVLLYGVITAYLFNREYLEGTLKNILTIPVSRTNFIISKFVLLFIWIITLSLFAWLLTLILGLIGQFEGLSTLVLVNSLKEYLIGGTLLFLLSPPVILITIIFKNFVPPIIFTIVVTIANIFISHSEYRAFYPWSAVIAILDIAKSSLVYSYISVIVTLIIGLTASIIYFKREDIS